VRCRRLHPAPAAESKPRRDQACPQPAKIGREDIRVRAPPAQNHRSRLIGGSTQRTPGSRRMAPASGLFPHQRRAESFHGDFARAGVRSRSTTSAAGVSGFAGRKAACAGATRLMQPRRSRKFFKWVLLGHILNTSFATQYIVTVRLGGTGICQRPMMAGSSCFQTNTRGLFCFKVSHSCFKEMDCFHEAISLTPL